MNKETFLKELRSHLQILEDQEQQDIIEEYTQHIDMKIQKGLSEEEAIKDFGPVKELAAGILEAYHVKPGFGEKKPHIKMPDLSGVKVVDGEKAVRNVKEKAGSAGRTIGKFFRAVGRKIKEALKWLTKPFRREKASGGMEGEEENMEQVYTEDPGVGYDSRRHTQRNTENRKGIGSALGRGLKDFWNGFMALCRWCLRLAWNLFWLFMTVLCGGFTAFLLFGFGAMVILVLQGYPLIGMTLMTFGLLLCGAAVTVVCFCFIRRKKLSEKEEETGKKAEEVEEVEIGSGLEKRASEELMDLEEELIKVMENEEVQDA